MHPRVLRPFGRALSAAALAAGLIAGVAADARGATPTPWSRVRTPAEGPARAIGAYSAGCVAGAVALPVRHPDWDVLRPERHRHFGHPELVDFIRTLAGYVHEQKLGRLRVGDLGQPRGGPAPNGHASHQSGLDVDLAYVLSPRGDGPALTPMVDRARQAPTDAFGEAQLRLLRLAAQDPRVARIFVNPVLKRALCEAPSEAGETANANDRAWRARIRPWWGHDQHFHVRLRCPADSPECMDQPALGADEGCADLEWWFADHSAEDRGKAAADYGKRVGGRPPLPATCEALLPPEPPRRRKPPRP